MRFILFFMISFCFIYIKAENPVQLPINKISLTHTRYVTTNSNNMKYEKYWRKYKILKATGWTAFSLGAAGTIVCVIGKNTDKLLNWSHDNNKGWNAGIGISACVLASSVPMLFFAYKNKRKAKNLSFTASSLSVDLPNGNRQTQPALGLCLNF